MATAPPPHSAATTPRRWRRELPFMLALFTLAFALYAATAPRAVTLEDDAMFIANLHFFGIAHPPGYPAHTLLGGIFYHLLPFGTPAYKAHLFSALCAAAAIAAVYAVTLQISAERTAALFAAAALAVSKTFWSQAIIAEVYTLNALLFFTLLALALRHVAAGGTGTRRLLLMGVIGGIGLANHYILFLLASSGIAIYTLWQIPRRPRAIVIAGATALATAALFYLWMIWRSYDTMPAHFYGHPLDSTERFLHYFLRRGYENQDNQPGVTATDKWQALAYLGKETAAQFTLAGAALATLGIVLMLRHRRHRLLAIAFLVSITATSPLIILARDFRADYLQLAVFSVYHLTSYGLLAIAMALAALAAARTAAAACKPRLPAAPLPPLSRLLTALLASSIVTATAAAHWQQNDRRQDHWAQDLAAAKLAGVSPNAIVFTDADIDLPLGYLHYVANYRPDITLIHIDGLLYANAPYSPFLPEDSPDGDDKKHRLQRLIATTHRPIYYPPHRRDWFDTPARGSDMVGFHRRVGNTPHNRIRLSPTVRDWLRTRLTAAIPPRDRWAQIQQTHIAQTLIGAALDAQDQGHPLDPVWRELIATAQERFPRIAMRVTARQLSDDRLPPPAAARALARCQNPHLPPQYDAADISQHYYLCARLHRHRHGTTATDPYMPQAIAAAARAVTPPPAIAAHITQQATDPHHRCQALQLAHQFYPRGDYPPAARAPLAAAGATCPPH